MRVDCTLPKWMGLMLACAYLLLLNIASAASPSGPSDRQYQAQWVWCDVESPKPFQFARFRKTIELASRPTRATAFITADTFYRLWINDQLVMHGPARSSRGKATVDPIDVGPRLLQGKNTLMVEVFHGAGPFEALAQSPGLLCELEGDFDGKKAILAATDATWEASEIAAWRRDSLRFNFQRGWIEQYDARRALQEKTRPAIVLGPPGMAPWQKIRMRDVPLPAPLAEVRPASVIAAQRGDGFAADFHGPETRIEPRAEWDERSEWFRRLHTEHLKADPSAATNPEGLTEKGRGDCLLHGHGASVSYDLGRGYVGFIGFEVSGKAGAVIEIAWNERLSRDGDVRPCAQTGRNAIQFTLRDGRQSFLAFTPQFVRVLRIAHRGEANPTVHRLWLTQFRFAAQPRGDFACSDEGINQVYQAARWTAALNTLDSYMDCPHRERNAMYGVEGYWMQKAVYPMFGDTSVSRRAILHGADSADDPQRSGPAGLVQIAYPMRLPFPGGVIPTQPLFWVLHAGLHEQCSGDTQFMRALLPVIRRNLAALDGWRNGDGLLESIPAWMFFDYADIRTDGVSVALNAIYARTLSEAARLERAVGDAPHAAQFARLAGQVRDSLDRLCPGETFYPDVLVRSPQKNLVPSRQACETTQYYVMWSGIVPRDREDRMWQALRDDFIPTPLRKVQPIQGLTRAGLYTFLERLEVAARLGDHAALLRDTKAMFLPMVHSAPGTLWEDPMAGIALCHSIGCGVGGILTEELLGIRLGFPLRITPHNGGALRWCKGSITTPKGRIEVAWECQKDRYQLRASLPEGIAAEVLLPPEAKAVWQLAPSTSPWRETLSIKARASVVVTPGNVEQQTAARHLPGANLTGSADIQVSSQQPQHPKTHATDGDHSTQWASAGEVHPWIRLDWKQPVTVGRLVLCDRGVPEEGRAQGGKILFSDGGTLDVDDIPVDGKPCQVRFGPRTVTWLRLDLFSARGKSPGLAEIEVYSDGGSTPQPEPTMYPAPGTRVTIAAGDPRIMAVDGVREGKWSGAMWCPFAGTSVKLIAGTGPNCGMADIYIDGIHRKTADWYSATDTKDATVFAAEKLADGKHLLGILARGDKCPAAKGTLLNWSRIEVVAGAHPQRFVPVVRTRFDPNVPLWLDDRGEPLQCHMGGIMHHEGKYYLLAMDWRGKSLPGFPFDWHKNLGFAVYSSTDLMNWTCHGNSCGPANTLDHPLYDYTHLVARVRPLRARGTGKFVALFEVVDEGFSEINVTAAAVADKPEGPYRWHGILQCNGKPVQGADTAVFTDDDGTQYLISGLAGPRDWNVADCLYQLAPDCLSAVKCKRLGTGGEAPALFKLDGVYYLLHSHLTGLGINDNFYHTATNLWGPWQAKGPIAQGPHRESTFLTQTMDVVPIAEKKDAFLWIGDSIRNNAPPYARTVWLPVTIKAKGQLEIRWRDSWEPYSSRPAR